MQGNELKAAYERARHFGSEWIIPLEAYECVISKESRGRKMLKMFGLMKIEDHEYVTKRLDRGRKNAKDHYEFLLDRKDSEIVSLRRADDHMSRVIKEQRSELEKAKKESGIIKDELERISSDNDWQNREMNKLRQEIKSLKAQLKATKPRAQQLAEMTINGVIDECDKYGLCTTYPTGPDSRNHLPKSELITAILAEEKELAAFVGESK